MRATEFVTESDKEHRDALEKTGFWGKQAAGCLFLAADTNRICIAHRSSQVEQPNTWGTWGGAIDAGENPAHAVKREVKEEAGYSGPLKLIPLYVFSHPSGFRYYNFLAIVAHEFKPMLNWETQGSEWVEFGDWPRPLHPGLASLLNDQESMSIIKRYTGKQELDELSFLGSPCTKDCSGHRAGYSWSKARGNRNAMSHSNSFNNGARLAAQGK
jgi:8-oxo-dGTP pyrophosphatase MutT (NUDIX family)